MNCIDFEAWISAEMDGELPELEASRLDAHVAVCDACRRVRDDYKVNRLLMRGMARQAAPADAHARLMARLAPHPTVAAPQSFSQRVSRRLSGRFAQSAYTTLRAVASLAIVLLSGLFLLGATDADVADAPTPPPHKVTVRPHALMRGHAYRQAANPTADRSAWHYLAIEEEILPAGDDDDDPTTPPQPVRGM